MIANQPELDPAVRGDEQVGPVAREVVGVNVVVARRSGRFIKPDAQLAELGQVADAKD